MEGINWIKTSDELPYDNQRVIAFVPGNKIYLPGKTGEFELREVIVLRFFENFYNPGSERCIEYGPHFWQGEGNSNHFFNDVTHWIPMPEKPIENGL
ncbi:MAG: DUF551 domain-containing protein [Flavobacteriales bacterium]|nr:DUF551 domain-containing protein [Flavobacteriales bacterium]